MLGTFNFKNLLMIYYVIFSFVVVIILINAKSKPSRWVLLFVFIFFFSLIGFRGKDVDNDYRSYLESIEFPRSSMIQEISFSGISGFFYTYLNSTVLTFVFYAFLGFGLKLINLKRYANFFWVSFMIYFSSLFILQEMNAMRAGVGAGFMLLSIKDWSEENWKKTIFLILIASFFHYSYIILLPLIGVVSNNDKHLIRYVMLIPLAYIFYYTIDLSEILMLIKISYIQFKSVNYLDSEEQFTNVFSTVFIVKIFIIYFLLLYRNKLCLYQRYFYIFLKLYCIGFFILIITAKLPAASMRFLDIFTIGELFLIPLFILLFKPEFRWFPIIGCILYSLFYLHLYVDVAKYVRDYNIIYSSI